MVDRYLTIASRTRCEETVKKSVFIGTAAPVNDEEAAVRFIEEVRKEYWDATHNVYAYKVGIGARTQRFSDDGEPSGTAGRPVLEAIERQDLTNIAVVVTRYFGGILLGAGGLVRAYSSCASKAISCATVIEMALHREIWFTVDYTFLGKLENYLRSEPVQVRDIKYTDRVLMHTLVPLGIVDNVLDEVAEITGASASVQLGEAVYAPVSGVPAAN